MADLRKRVTDPATSRVDNITALHSLGPKSMKAHLNFHQPTSQLGLRQKCLYYVQGHAEGDQPADILKD